MRNQRLDKNKKDLIKRYLIWCYKTTKEEFDRIDRYFTQYLVDEVILRELKKDKSYRKSAAGYSKLVDDFSKYMQTKQSNALRKKFINEKLKKLRPNYIYLTNRLRGVERAIIVFLGMKELSKIIADYEEEMIRRIWQSTEY